MATISPQARATDDKPWLSTYQSKFTSPATAVKRIRRGQRVFIGSGCAEPQSLVTALAERGPHLADNPVVHILTLGVAPYAEERFSDQFRHNAFFVGPNVRGAIAEGRADYTPIFLSEIPALFREHRIPIDVALIAVSPPDEHGFCSYGVSVDVVKSATESASMVIAEVNPNMPRTLGDSFIHVNHIDWLIDTDEPVLEADHGEPDDVAQRIGQHIADLIDDGSTLQLGIGTIPDAVLACLGDKKDLGIHTEMFAEGVIDLVNRGVINGRCKTIHPGKIVASFVMGTRRMYDFIDNNPMCEFHPTEYTNDPFRIARNDKMVAINSALEVDLTGQVCADSLGEYFYSGIGGQVDFIRGASRSKGGKPIIALPSTAKGGEYSRIVSDLKPGAGVVTSRGDVHYVVTEWGAADLHGKTIRERALALIHIAHPKFRDELMEEARRRHMVYADQVAVPGAGAPDLRELESDFELPDGTNVHFRPIRPTDEDMHREMFYSFSERTIYHRFFEQLKALPQRRRREFCSIDYEREMALVGIVHADGHDQIVAVGRYGVYPATKSADIAFVVRDAYQDRGIGKHLFRQLLATAKQRGVQRITADVMAENHRMIHLFHVCSEHPIQSTLDTGIYHLEFDL